MTKNYHKIIFIIGLVFIIMGLPLSKASISIGELILFLNWLIDKNLGQKIKTYFSNSFALLFSSLFFLLLFGLLWTSDFDYAALDLKTKLPLLLFPLVFSTTHALSKIEIRNLLLFFVLAVFVSLSISEFRFLTQSFSDSRNAIKYVSHIRLGIMCALAIFILFYYSVKEFFTQTMRAMIFAFWILLFLLMMINLELMSGVVVIVITVAISIIVYIFRSKKSTFKIVILISSSILLVLLGLRIYFLISAYQYVPSWSIKNLPTQTASGNLYSHNPEKYPVENGSYIGLYICVDELRNEWNKRSSMNFDSLDAASQPLHFTLIRFLNSKHLTKDSVGLNKLSNEEIKMVESGIANIAYTSNFSIKKRLYKVMWEWNIYKKEGQYAGQSVIQRFELWRVGMVIFKDNFWFGVGTGDIKKEFASRLVKEKSMLANSGLRSHNQFISTAISFGIFGLFLFVFVLFYPILRCSHQKCFLYFTFAITLLVSMIWEDTLETLVGVTLFAFFNSFYWFYREEF